MINVQTVAEVYRSKVEQLTGLRVELYGVDNRPDTIDEGVGVLTYELNPQKADGQTHWTEMDLTLYASADLLDYEGALIADGWESGPVAYDGQGNKAATWTNAAVLI